MSFVEVCTLIPGYDLDAFPTELPEEQAESILNCFAVMWHPAILQQLKQLPTWRQAESAPEIFEERLVLIPTACEYVEEDFADRVREVGGEVIQGLVKREEWLEALLRVVNQSAEQEDSKSDHTHEQEETAAEVPGGEETSPELSTDLANDFLALGSCYLQTELLSRHMHHFSSVDEISLRLASVEAAQAALAGEEAKAREGLRRSFELLTDVREQFYPIQCYLIDLCLLSEEVEIPDTEDVYGSDNPKNYLVTAQDLEIIAHKQPQLCRKMAESWEEGRIDFCGGEWIDRPSTLLPMESVLHNLKQGHQTFFQVLGKTPSTWGRRRFGFSALLPHILNGFGYEAAFHFALDEGVYPDEELMKFRWEGVEGTTINACSKIPLAADSAGSFLKFAVRLSESMEQDQVAGILFARWPDGEAPWLEDFRRMARYSPVFGEFITWEQFFQEAESHGQQSYHAQKKYMTPALIQRVAYELPDPISQFVEHFTRRKTLDSAIWCYALTSLLCGRTIGSTEVKQIEDLVEQAGPVSELPFPDEESEPIPDLPSNPDQELERFQKKAVQKLSDLILAGAGEESGTLLINPLLQKRRTVVYWPESEPFPELDETVRAVQEEGPHRAVVVDLPPSGFAWVKHASEPSPALPQLPFPAVEENILRNEYFEVHMNPATGGIAKIKAPGRKPPRLSQQVAYRFPREQTYAIGSGNNEEVKSSWYSEPVCRRAEVTSSGPVVLEYLTETDLYDPVRSLKVATVNQTTRLYRGCKFVDVSLVLDIEQMPLADPWNNYYGLRFAWNDGFASVTNSIQHNPFDFEETRFESTEYIEIMSEGEPTTIISPGLAFHRETGPRMLDTLLIAGKEQRRHFDFRIVLDEAHPLKATWNYSQPPIVVPAAPGPPRSGKQGWFFHVNASNVQLSRIDTLKFDPHQEYVEESSDENEIPQPADSLPKRPRFGYTLRMLETEGRAASVHLQCFRTPSFARQRDFNGKTITQLPISGDRVYIDLTPHEVADVELWYSE